MPVQKLTQHCVKAVVSVTAMAKAVGMSRSRFYDYIRIGAFPQPVYSVVNRRPLYLREQQQEIISIRQTGIGANGQYVLFYERHPSQAPVAVSGSRSDISAASSALLDGLKALGLTAVTSEQVSQAIVASFPGGTAGTDSTTVLRAVYRHLRRLGIG